MAIGFVLITVSPNEEHLAYNQLREIPEITEVHPLFGEYDLLAKIAMEELDDIGNIVLNKIRKTRGVIDTKTLTGIKINRREINK